MAAAVLPSITTRVQISTVLKPAKDLWDLLKLNFTKMVNRDRLLPTARGT